MALRRLLVRGGQSLQLQQQQSSLPALGAAWARQLSGKSTFEDKEHAMEDLYIKVSAPDASTCFQRKDRQDRTGQGKGGRLPLAALFCCAPPVLTHLLDQLN